MGYSFPEENCGKQCLYVSFLGTQWSKTCMVLNISNMPAEAIMEPAIIYIMLKSQPVQFITDARVKQSHFIGNCSNLCKVCYSTNTRSAWLVCPHVATLVSTLTRALHISDYISDRVLLYLLIDWAVQNEHWRKLGLLSTIL